MRLLGVILLLAGSAFGQTWYLEGSVPPATGGVVPSSSDYICITLGSTTNGAAALKAELMADADLDLDPAMEWQLHDHHHATSPAVPCAVTPFKDKPKDKYVRIESVPERNELAEVIQICTSYGDKADKIVAKALSNWMAGKAVKVTKRGL